MSSVLVMVDIGLNIGLEGMSKDQFDLLYLVWWISINFFKNCNGKNPTNCCEFLCCYLGGTH